MVSSDSVPLPNQEDTRPEVLQFVARLQLLPLDLSPAEHRVYSVVLLLLNRLPWEDGPLVHVPVWRIARDTNLTPATVGKLLAQLAVRGLLERKTEPDNDPETNTFRTKVFVAPRCDPRLLRPEPEPESDPARGEFFCPGCGRSDLEPLTYLRCKHCHYAIPRSQAKKRYPKWLWVVPPEPEPEPEPEPAPEVPIATPTPSQESKGAPFAGAGDPSESAASVAFTEPAQLPEPRPSWVSLPLPAGAPRPWWPCDCGKCDWLLDTADVWYCGRCGATCMAEGLPP